MYQFDEKKTIESTFYTLNGSEPKTQMMVFDDFDLEETKFNYTHDSDLKAQVKINSFVWWQNEAGSKCVEVQEDHIEI